MYTQNVVDFMYILLNIKDPDGLKEVKQYKTVLLTGSTVQDGQYSQIFQLSAALLNQPNKRYSLN